MEQIEHLESSANLSTSIHDVQKAIDLLAAARSKIAAGRTCISRLLQSFKAHGGLQTRT